MDGWKMWKEVCAVARFGFYTLASRSIFARETHGTM